MSLLRKLTYIYIIFISMEIEKGEVALYSALRIILNK